MSNHTHTLEALKKGALRARTIGLRNNSYSFFPNSGFRVRPSASQVRRAASDFFGASLGVACVALQRWHASIAPPPVFAWSRPPSVLLRLTRRLHKQVQAINPLATKRRWGGYAGVANEQREQQFQELEERLMRAGARHADDSSSGREEHGVHTGRSLLTLG